MYSMRTLRVTEVSATDGREPLETYESSSLFNDFTVSSIAGRKPLTSAPASGTVGPEDMFHREMSVSEQRCRGVSEERRQLPSSS